MEALVEKYMKETDKKKQNEIMSECLSQGFNVQDFMAKVKTEEDKIIQVQQNDTREAIKKVMNDSIKQIEKESGFKQYIIKGLSSIEDTILSPELRKTLLNYFPGNDLVQEGANFVLDLFFKVIRTAINLFAHSILNLEYWKTIGTLAKNAWNEGEGSVISAGYRVVKKITAALCHTLIICIENAMEKHNVKLTDSEKKMIADVVDKKSNETLAAGGEDKKAIQ